MHAEGRVKGEEDQRERGRERENLKQVPHPAWSPTRGSVS